ncbi:NCS2 family permease [Shewanella surugensis]|uniref:NCS2 family permease n=1 Tax=Shewanella surugensis TaxID=212020 RepID=A0ABT0LEX3_9GAMM|nr:NCS2 family permease [Shewanella surugensis]MCL1126262.1 NCS2 family permease [Shewanella surugensis]
MKGLFERLFKLESHHTNIQTEIIAGVTTFFTMVYIIFVNPQILAVAGMDKGAVFVTTCLIAGLGSILMGLMANLPVALAPAMGLNVFFAFVVTLSMQYSWQVGMGTIFWGAFGVFLLTVFRIRYWILSHIPVSLRIGIVSGIGLMIAFMGLQNMGIVVKDPDTMLALGDLSATSNLLGALGFFIIVCLAARGIHAAVLISLCVTTLISFLIGDVQFHGFVSLPPSISPILGQLDVTEALRPELAGIIFSFMLVNLFDSTGTLVGLTDKAGLIKGIEGKKQMKRALLVDSSSSMFGAVMGTSSVGAYIESASGISVGGRTGLVAVVVGILFLLAIFISPLIQMVPIYAAAGALVYVGVLMVEELAKVKWQDLTEAAPAFLTAIMMPFSFSITDGIALGFMSYVIIKLGAGRYKELNLCVWGVALAFLAKYLWI